MSKKFYITTPIFYPNGVPHIGHAYNAIATDIFARFYRLLGQDVFFVSGTDEHGLKMQQTAEKEGISPQELADKNSAVFKKMLAMFNCSNNEFIRTTQDNHQKACVELWTKMADAGDIYLNQYKGWYSVRQESYFDEDETYVDLEGVRRESLGSVVNWNEEDSYFFRLSSYQDRLLELYEKNPGFIGPKERRNEVVRFVESGLKDLSISRTSFKWGIPVPSDPKHIMYVWVDALTSYLSALGYPETTNVLWNYWPAQLHLIGKDILRFHAVYWPAFLMSAGISLPDRIFAHGFILNRNEKMSKSVGNVLDPFELIDAYGLDAIRYFLMREISFGQDGNLTHSSLVSRVNADLANDLGNLAQRCLSMIAKNCDGIMPKISKLTSVDRQLLEKNDRLFNKVADNMASQAIHLALNEIFLVISDTNRYFSAQKPWSLSEEDPLRFETVLGVTIQILYRIGILLLPFIPDTANKLLDNLSVPLTDRNFLNLKDYIPEPKTILKKPQAIFPRLLRVPT